MCRRRGELGTSYVPDYLAFDPHVMGPYQGVYRVPEPHVRREIHLNFGSAGCMWIDDTGSLPQMWPSPKRIEDRQAERAQALVELTIERNKLTVCSDGN